jgi:hypothetical protein
MALDSLRRGALPTLGVLLLVAVAVGMAAICLEAWAGLYPRSPTLARAARWPVIGDWVALARTRHVRPRAPRQPLAERGIVVLRAAAPAPSEPPLRGPADLPAGVWPELWLEEGEALHAAPSAESPVVIASTAIANVPVLEARGSWRRVRWRGREGWVTGRTETAPPLGSAVEPVRPVTGRAADPAHLAVARALLAGAGAVEPPARRLGPYMLLTDVDEAVVLLLLDRAAGGVEEAYRARYGLDLVGAPAETVVLFRHRASYDAYLARTGGPPAATGHYAGGVVALHRHGRLLEDVRRTLVHELVHALNRRGLGPALPPWLDEGMADDLADSRVGEGARTLPGTLSGTTVRAAGFFELHGGEAALELLRRQLAEGGLVPLERLLALDGVELRGLRPAGYGYAEASFFVRFLLDGELAPRFRAFLRQVAEGEPPTPAALAASLGRTFAELDAALAAWVPAPAADPEDQAAQRDTGQPSAARSASPPPRPPNRR